MHISDRLDAFVRLILITIIGALPFFFVPVSWILLTQAKVILVAVALILAGVLWLIARFAEGGVKLPWTSALLAAILVPLVYAISAALSGFQNISLMGSGIETDTLAFVCVGFTLFALSACLFSMHPGKVVSAIRALFVGSFILFIVQIAHFIFPSIVLGGVLAGQTGNLAGGWHEFAMFAGLIGFLGIALLNTAVTAGWWRYVASICAVLAGAFLMITNYFDILILAFGASVLLILVRVYRNRAAGHEFSWKGNGALTAGALVALFLAVFGAFVLNVLPERIRVAQNDVRPSFTGTFAIGQQSLAKPLTLLFGAGPNTFMREWGLYKPVDVNQTDFWNAEFPVGAAPIATSFITVGLFGLFAWIAFMLAVFFSIVKLWLSTTETAAASIALPLSIATLYLFALYLVSAPGVVLALLMFFSTGLLIALLAPSFVSVKNIALTKGGANHLVFGTAIIGTLVLIVSAGASLRVVAAETIVNKGIVIYNETQSIEQATSAMQFALRIYSGSDRAHTSAVQLGLASLKELIASADPEDEAATARLQAALEETIQHGLSAVAINGGSYQNWLLLASLYAQLAGSNVEGAYENARAAFDRALAENPTSPVPYFNVAQLELLQENPAVALQLLAKAVELKPNFAVAYYLASQIYAGQEDYQNALQAAANAAKYAPGDAEAWYNLGVVAYSAKSYPDAASALQQALVIQPRFANAMYVLALTGYRGGDKAGALEVLKSLNELSPGQAAVEQMIEDLSAGRDLTEAQLSGQSRETPENQPAQ